MVLFYFIAFVVLTSTPAFSDDQIDHANFLADDISKLYLDDSFSDVYLEVENERLHAHRLVLNSRSAFFSTFPYDHEEDGKKIVSIPEASASAFKLVLGYLYSGRMNLSTLESDDYLELNVLWNTFLRSTPVFSNEPIDEAHFLADDISKLFLDESSSDVVLVVENERFHAHRLVLASRSDFFNFLLYGEHKEGKEVNVSMKEISATSFRVLLGYIYSGRMDLRDLEGKVVLEVLILANRFFFTNLQITLLDYLRTIVSLENICSLIDVACIYHFKDLEAVLLDFIDAHALEVLRSEDSPYLSSEAFQLVIDRDTVPANEIEIFRAACRWIKHNQAGLSTEVKTKILSAVRYQFMADDELSEVWLSEPIGSDKNVFDVIRAQSLASNPKYRGQSEPNVNFLQSLKRSQVEGGTMVELDRLSVINYIEMQLFDLADRSYSYYVEVSVDKLEWLRIIDYSYYHCRSKQRLWIKPRFVRYIRLVVANDDGTSKIIFDIWKVMYNADNEHLTEIKNGFLAPKYNVALRTMHAIVIEGTPRTPFTSLVNGDYPHYDLHHGYTSHTLEWGCIEVQLAQPYWLDSMRLLLYDCDGQSYGYFIEVSLNYTSWETIADTSKELVESWQVIRFEAKLISYIRITGTRSSTDDGVFRIVHLEAPSSQV